MTTDSKKVIITGGGGFVGKYLSQYLVEQGFVVYGFDRHGSDIPNITTVIIDILDKEKVDKYIQQISPTHLIHLAAQSSVKKSWDNPTQTISINVEGTRNILESITLHTPKCTVLIISSAEIYGTPKILPITEQTPINPNNPYAESRKQQEELCQNFITKNKLNLIIARSFPHTGAGQSDQFVCSNFAKQIALIEANQQPPILTVGNLEAKRDFTDVRDVVRAYHLLITTPHTSGVFNVCSAKSIPISSILSTLQTFSTSKITIKQDPDKMRPSDIPNMVGSNTKLQQATNWKPIIPINQTLQEILHYWRNEILKNQS